MKSSKQYLNELIEKIERPKMKKNILDVTHVTNEGIYHDLSLDLDAIKVIGISDWPGTERERAHRTLVYMIPGSRDENLTKVTDSYQSLRERIWGITEESK